MQIRIRSRFLHKLVIKAVNWLLTFSLNEKVSRAEANLAKFPARLACADRVYTLCSTMYASESCWPRVGQQIRLDIRRARRLYQEAADLYEDYRSFVGPRLFFPQLDAMEAILTRISSAHTELTVTLEQLNPSK